MCGHLICPKGSQRNLKIFPIPLSVWAGGPSGSSSSGAWEERSLRLLSTRPGAREARGSLLLSIQLWAVYAVGRSVCCTCSVCTQHSDWAAGELLVTLFFCEHSQCAQVASSLGSMILNSWTGEAWKYVLLYNTLNLRRRNNINVCRRTRYYV